MDNDDLFDDFNSIPNGQMNIPKQEVKEKNKTKGKSSQPESLLGQKHTRLNNSSSTISASKTTPPKEQSNTSWEVSNYNPKNKNDNSTVNIEDDALDEDADKTEDILLSKSITRILPDFSASKPQVLPSITDDPANLGMKIITEQFQGGFHENIVDATYKGDSSLKESWTPPATSYPFKLDQFQERSIKCLENHQSVLVAAHTSAGKTVVAQYAIAMALRDHQRVIYTSPIKALSNQKYRELQHQFKDVGLMTGDVTLNSTASCIVMTTEILRNMLFKGSEITKEIAWVIFDEVHYMRDKERGVVWEETMIWLSNKINYVFLSATIPNAREFGMWIAKLKNQPCNVVYTDYRPVPLQHYIYPNGGKGIYLIVDAKGGFREEAFENAWTVIKDESCLDTWIDLKNRVRGNNYSKNSNKKKQGDQIKQIVSLIQDKELTPAIIFSFSKRECEDHALSWNKMDFTTNEEKELIEMIYLNAIATIAEEDQQLPQIKLMLPILKNGVGIHHGGMLPIVKECVELIFQEGWIKILFSTETFSMGINMPAKTVVFTSVEKWDGENRRWLGGGEYIQMSGRAGRRGIDDRGITIMMLNKNMDPKVCRNMLSGVSDPLNSSFHWNYNQLVNLYRVEGWDTEYVVKRSFRQFQSERNVPIMKQEVEEKYRSYLENNADIGYDKLSLIRKMWNIKEQINAYTEENRKIIWPYFVPYLCPGRLVKVSEYGYGIVINYEKKHIEILKKGNIQSLESYEEEKETVVVDTLVYVYNYVDPDNKLIPGDINLKNGKLGIVPFAWEAFEYISTIKVNLPKDLKSEDNMKTSEKILFEIIQRIKPIPIMDPINDMKINDSTLKSNVKKIKKFQSRLKDLEQEHEAFYGQPIDEKEINSYQNKIKNREEIKEIIAKIINTKKLVLQDNWNSMRRVLRRWEFVKDDIITTKGQVACNISSGDEWVLTEMLFNGALNDIESEWLAAVLTCFLSKENSGIKEENNKTHKVPMLQKIFEMIQENAERIGKILVESKIETTEEEYKSEFKSDYMYPIYQWACGKKLAEILETPDLFEGSLIRIIRRLDELIKQVIESAVLIGNVNLKEKWEKSSTLIRRGLPFAASLYLSDKTDK